VCSLPSVVDAPKPFPCGFMATMLLGMQLGFSPRDLPPKP
jgi:hypothetical protein